MRLNEVHLARQLGVSRTPLREALTRLVSEGLVDSRPRRGFFARPLSLGEFRELYPLRAHLDPFALRLAGIPGARRLAALRGLNRQIAAAGRHPSRVIDLALAGRVPLEPDRSADPDSRPGTPSSSDSSTSCDDWRVASPG